MTEEWIKRSHTLLKQGTSDARKSWFKIGDYKKIPNEVGGRETTAPEDVSVAIAELLNIYHQKGSVDLETILDFHVQF